MKRRIMTFLLAVCMAVSLLAVPAGAANTAAVTFSDVGDKSTAVAVESLRLLGVLDGYGDGTFRPGTVLTRAQFCKMAVYAMNGSNELGRYRTVTVFSDVKPSYWAAPYINMAAKGKNIISGYADGKFHPDRTVTVGQAVTILLRMLGYKDEDVGGVWPDSYMAEAALIGLTDGVSGTGNEGLTRGQAAKLFLNLLRADQKEGGSYLATLGETRTGQMLVSSTADGPRGAGTALQMASGAVYSLADGKVSNGMLNGTKGTLLLSKNGNEALTFVPDSVGSSKVVVLSTAKATELTDTTGTKYVMDNDTGVYYNGKESVWSEVYSWLNAGTSLTLYLDAGGGVDYVFVGGGGTTSNEAVIIYEKGSTSGFSSLAGGTSGYAIYKNGLPATAGDMRKYDVATYSSTTNSIRVCDTRITGYYEDCYPNPKEPTKITVLGYEFNVLPTAMQTVSQFKPGDQITLLLTEDNQVAGAVAASGNTATGNAIGIARGLQRKRHGGPALRHPGEGLGQSLRQRCGAAERPAGAGLLQPEGRPVPDPPDGRRLRRAECGGAQAGQPESGGQCGCLPERRQRPHRHQPVPDRGRQRARFPDHLRRHRLGRQGKGHRAEFRHRRRLHLRPRQLYREL